MHGLVAAVGAAVKRFDDLAAALAPRHELHELTLPSERVRLGFAGSHSVVCGGRDGPRAVAVLGSAVLHQPTLPAQLVEAGRHDPLRLLDGRPDDLVALMSDDESGTLTIAAGAGMHRLFVADVDGGALVSTQLAPLARALGPDLALDRTYEDFLLGFGFLPDGRTPYARINILGPGTARALPTGQERKVDRGTGSETTIDLRDPTAVSTELHARFFDALAEQAGSHRRHAVLLGGFDSALVAAGLRQMGHEVECYTFGFGDPRYEQRNVASFTSSIGAPHHWVRFDAPLVGDLLDHFDTLINQPGAQPHYQLHTVHASTIIAADGHSHVFTGDGCDAAFLGYPTVNRRARALARLGSVPAPVLNTISKLAGRPSVEKRLGHIARMSRSMLENLSLPEPARSHLPTRYLDDTALARLRAAGAPPQAESVTVTRERLAAPTADLDPTRRAFQGNAMTGQSKAKVEGSVATSGVAQFSPFMHPLLKDFAAQLPLEALRPEGSKASAAGKAVLVAMARKYALVPETIITMPKQSPSDSPIDRWYAGPLRPLVDELMGGLPFEIDRSYLDEILAPKRAEELFRSRVSISHHAFQAIGLLCSYATFTRRAG
jgi:hypothetical protein